MVIYAKWHIPTFIYCDHEQADPPYIDNPYCQLAAQNPFHFFYPGTFIRQHKGAPKTHNPMSDTTINQANTNVIHYKYLILFGKVNFISKHGKQYFGRQQQ